MLHPSSEQIGINDFQFMHTSYQRKNFIYCLVDRSCKVLIAFPECPQSPVEAVSEGDKWPDGFSDKGGYSAAHRRCTQQFTGTRKIPMAAGLGPPTDLGSAFAQQGVKLWYPQALADRRPVLKAQVMLLH